MIIEEESLPNLHEWIMKHIAPITQAEPQVLANYILALLQNDKPNSELVEQLEDFLKEDTSNFVTQLFEVLKEDSKTGKHIFVNPPPSIPPSSGASVGNGTEQSGSDNESDQDRDHKHSRREHEGEQPSKRRRQDDFRDDSRKTDRSYHRKERERYSPTREDEYDERDRHYRRDRYDKRGRRPRYERHENTKKVEKCRDYEEMGFCKKGELCPFDHGTDPIVVTDMTSLEQLKRNHEDQESNKRDSYDPEAPLFQGQPVNNNWQGFPLSTPGFVNPMAVNISGLVGMNPSANVPGSLPLFPLNSSDDTIIQVGGKGMYRSSTQEKRDSFRDKDKYKGKGNPYQNTLVISNIPAELNTIDKLNSHFKQFGTIVNIQVKPQISKAFVQFSAYTEAEKALKSPNAILGNRFIRVNWSKKSDPRPPEVTKPPEFQSIDSNKLVRIATTPAASKEDKAKVLKDLQEKKLEIRKTQLEQTKQILDTLSKAKNMDPQERLSLMKKLESLTSTVATSIAKDTTKTEPTKQPIQKVKKTKAELERERLDKELEQMAKTVTKGEKDDKATAGKDDTTAPQVSNLEKLQKKYAAVKNIAANLGIDPSLSPTAPVFKRGRRGRGAAILRGTRGALRGRVKRAMVLDNRPTTLRLEHVPKDLRSSDALLAHFKNFGEVVSVTRQGNDNEVATVQFATRRAAETALARGKTMGSYTLHIGWNVPKASSADNQAGLEEEAEDATQNPEALSIQEEVYQQPEQVEETEYFEEAEEEDDERSWKRQQ